MTQHVAEVANGAPGWPRGQRFRLGAQSTSRLADDQQRVQNSEEGLFFFAQRGEVQASSELFDSGNVLQDVFKQRTCYSEDKHRIHFNIAAQLWPPRGLGDDVEFARDHLAPSA